MNSETLPIKREFPHNSLLGLLLKDFISVVVYSHINHSVYGTKAIDPVNLFQANIFQLSPLPHHLLYT